MSEAVFNHRVSQTSSTLVRLCTIAKGGMGTVDLVLRTDGDFERLCAVKRILPEHLESESAHAMFLREARLAGMIRHANVVSVLDVGRDDDGPYLVMDYVEGLPLQVVLKDHASRKATVPAQFVLQVIAQSAAGLHAAHVLQDSDGQPLGLVHRDISPSNILVGFDGIVRVSDFGIAKAFGHDSQTTTGVLRGKLPYMPPEQLRFQRPDLRGDIFSLGCVFFQALSRRLLFVPDRDGLPSQFDANAFPNLPEELPGVHPAIVATLQDLTAFDREQRPKSAREVALRLNAIAAELAAREGKLDVGEYMETHFSQHHREVQQRIRDLRERVRKGPQIDPESSANAPLPSPVTVTDEKPARAAPDAEWMATTRAEPVASAFADPIAASPIGRTRFTWQWFPVAATIVLGLALAYVLIRPVADPLPPDAAAPPAITPPNEAPSTHNEPPPAPEPVAPQASPPQAPPLPPTSAPPEPANPVATEPPVEPEDAVPTPEPASPRRPERRPSANPAPSQEPAWARDRGRTPVMIWN